MTPRKPWKRIENLMPPEDEWVLLNVKNYNDEVYIGYYNSEKEMFYCKDTGSPLYNVTHWMEIPNL